MGIGNNSSKKAKQGKDGEGESSTDSKTRTSMLQRARTQLNNLGGDKSSDRFKD